MRLSPHLKTLFFICLVPYYANAQMKEEEKAAFNVVQNLFLAMETNDSTLAASLFTDDAQLFTIYKNDQGNIQLRQNPASRLSSAFAQPKAITWHEPIWNEKIEISDGLASIWVDYAFYLDSDFSHCGVDAFHLVRLDDDWKIFHLADTRRTDNCDIPQEISSKYEK